MVGGKFVYIIFSMQFFYRILILYGLDGQPAIKFFRDDYKYLDDTRSFYKIHTLAKTWDDAKRRCALEGTTLFYPEDQNEADAVLGYLNNTQQSLSWLFVGISSKLAKGVFITIDGAPIRIVYSKWASGEPNDGNNEEDCVVMKSDGFFNDEKCNNKYPFICKKTFQTLKWNEECNVPYMDYVYSEELGGCYKFHLNPMNWKNALVACDAEQSHLAVINSQREANHLANMTAWAPKDTIQGSYLRGAVHLGFRYNETRDDWITVKGETLQQAGYAGWGNYQPDGGQNERCGSMFYGGELNDIGCEVHKCFFICERENKLSNEISKEIDDSFVVSK